MANPSRSKQPAFDPAELADLILTPAVGTGVGSHLVQPETNQTTQDMSGLSTVARSNQPLSPLLPPARQTTNLSSVDTSHLPTEVMLPHERALQLWVTETGDVVPPNRVKPIRRAQDVLNSAEEAVHNALWTAESAVRVAGDAYRTTQAGYDYLIKTTGFSKKTIQRIVDRLLAKDFIAIDRPADIYQRSSTTYRVYAYQTVLDRQAASGRHHVVKIGPGYRYVHPGSTAAARS